MHLAPLLAIFAVAFFVVIAISEHVRRAKLSPAERAAEDAREDLTDGWW